MSSEDINSMNRYLIDKVAEQANKIGELERENRDLREQLQKSVLVKDKKYGSVLGCKSTSMFAVCFTLRN